MAKKIRAGEIGLRLPHFAQRIFNTPLAIAPDKAEVILRVLGPRLGAYMDDGVSEEGAEREEREDLSSVIPPGTALVMVDGTLAHRAIGLRPMSGLTTYADIRAEFLTALRDPSVKNIVLDCDSPGGEVNGLFDLVDTIYEARGTKPIYALVDQQATSACYAIASAADRIIIPRTGVVGSIAVLTAHVDQSKRDEGMGLVFTYITSGEEKIDGNPHQPLSDGARQRITAEIMRVADILSRTVARNRGMTPESVTALKGGLRYGELAIEAGLADEVMSPYEFLDRLREESSPKAIRQWNDAVARKDWSAVVNAKSLSETR